MDFMALFHSIMEFLSRIYYLKKNEMNVMESNRFEFNDMAVLKIV